MMDVMQGGPTGLDQEVRVITLILVDHPVFDVPSSILLFFTNLSGGLLHQKHNPFPAGHPRMNSATYQMHEKK